MPVSGTRQTGKAIDADVNRRALLRVDRVSEALRGYHDWQVLFGNLAKELRPCCFGSAFWAPPSTVTGAERTPVQRGRAQEPASRCRHHTSMPTSSVVVLDGPASRTACLSFRGRKNPVPARHRLPGGPRVQLGMPRPLHRRGAVSACCFTAAGNATRDHAEVSPAFRIAVAQIRSRRPSRTRRTTRRRSTRSRSSQSACATSRRATNCCARCPRSSHLGGVSCTLQLLRRYSHHIF